MVLDDKIRFELHTPANTSRRSKGVTDETSGNSDSGTVCVSDDPRRGARLKNTERKETKLDPQTHLQQERRPMTTRAMIFILRQAERLM